MTDPPEGEEWNVREDHLLLDAVEMFGYGNWKDIARYRFFLVCENPCCGSVSFLFGSADPFREITDPT